MWVVFFSIWILILQFTNFNMFFLKMFLKMGFDGAMKGI